MKTLCVLLSLVVLCLSACGESNVCTEIGCQDGFTLTVVDEANTAFTTFTGTVSVGGIQTAITCDATKSSGPGYTCANNSVTVSGTPTTTITVNLSAGAKQAQEVLNVTPRSVQPNGPDCEPTCTQASATLTLK